MQVFRAWRRLQPSTWSDVEQCCTVHIYLYIYIYIYIHVYIPEVPTVPLNRSGPISVFRFVSSVFRCLQY